MREADEGDSCPKCKTMLEWTQEKDTGINILKCPACNYDATEDMVTE